MAPFYPSHPEYSPTLSLELAIKATLHPCFSDFWNDRFGTKCAQAVGIVPSVQVCYAHSMEDAAAIPAFGLYGETRELPDVLHCEAFSARAPVHNWRIAAHRHTHMSQLLTVANGRIKALADGKAHTLGAGQFLYVPELCVHAFEFDPGTEGLVFSFPIPVVQSVGPNPEDVRRVLSAPISGPLSEQLHALVNLLAETATGSSAFRRQSAVALTHATLATLADTQQVRMPKSSGSTVDRLQALDALILNHAAEGWTVSKYAQTLKVSTGHLSRLCRQSTGLGVAAYIERKVMSEACRLLAFTQLPVSEIGYRMGYGDPSYFSKRFTKVQGQTPSTYRRSFTG